MASGRFLDYFAYGDTVDRPVAPDLYPGALGLYFNVDSDPLILSIWQDDGGGPAWVDLPIKANGILNGVIPPDDITDGVDGDFFIDTAASDLYGPKAGGVWPAGVSLIGPPGSSSISDVAYDATSWDGVTTDAPSKNAVRDIIETLIAAIAAIPSPDDTAYDATSWNANTDAPTKNVVRDQLEFMKFESMVVALSDEITEIAAAGIVLTWYMPYAFEITEVFIGLTTPSSAGDVETDLSTNGVSVFTTLPVIQATEDTSLTGTPAVMNDGTTAKGDKMEAEITSFGADAAGLKMYIIGYKL